MSQAQTLLDNLNDAEMPSETDYIVIDDQRFITVPEKLRRLGVQHDHNIETVAFICPRFWDGHDMSTMKIYINYMCPNGTKGKCLTENLQVDGDTMTFDWTISGNVTQAKGTVSFLVCIMETDDDGNETRHWNSELNQQCTISSGLECDEIALVQYPDIITYLLVRMDELESGAGLPSGSGGSGLYILSEGETIEDVPPEYDLVYDPYAKPEVDIPVHEADISLNVEGASVGQIVKVAAVDEAGKPTAWEAVEMPSGGNEWVKLGDSTVDNTYEFIPTSFTGGVVTIDPNSEGYEYIIGRSATICVVHPINIALKEAAVVGVLKLKDANAGTFDFYDRDNNPKTNAAYDPAKYKISVLNVASIAFQNVENYQRYKLRVTSPVISTNGLRPFFASSMTGLSLGACVNVLKTGGVIIEREFYQFPGDENYMYVRTCISYGAFYGGISTNEMQSIEIIATGEGKTKPPLNKEVSFTASNMIFVNGTRFELWGG